MKADVRETSSRIKVAFVAPALHPGGAERQMLYITRAIDRDRFEVRFLLLSDRGSLAAEAESFGATVHVLGLRRGTPDTKRRERPRQVVNALRAYRTLTRGVQVVDAWLVPAYTFAGLALPLARVPVLVAGRRSTLDVNRTRRWYREMAASVAMRGVKAVVANSEVAARQAVEAEGVDASMVVTIPNGVEPVTLPDLERRRLRDSWGASDKSVVVGCVGNLKEGKGHELLIDVADVIRDQIASLRFVFVGDGPKKEQLEKEIIRRGLAAKVVIASDIADARPVYGAFDVSVQASDSEGLPNTILEAAAAGRPIAATAVGGTGEIITDGRDGLLVPRRDRNALAAAVLRLAQDPALRAQLGAAAAARSRDFSVERLVRSTSELYERLLQENVA